MQSRDSVPVQSDLLSAINQLGGSDVHIQAGADFHIAHLLNPEQVSRSYGCTAEATGRVAGCPC